MKLTTRHLMPLPLVLAAALGGCYQGPNANTTVQDETGNGIAMDAGQIQIESVTIVAGSDGDQGSVSAVIVNAGTEADELRSIEVGGRSATLDPDGIEVAPQESVSVRTDGDATALVPLGGEMAGDFVEVTFSFASSGEASDLVLIVPPVGYYEGLGPAADQSAGSASGDGADEASDSADEAEE